jgi:hypothetical protein
MPATAIADTFAITTFIAFTFWIVDLLSQRAEADLVPSACLFFPRSAFQHGFDFDGFRHQLVTCDFQGPSYLLSKAGDSRAVKTVFRLAQKALCIGARGIAMRLGKVDCYIPQ